MSAPWPRSVLNTAAWRSASRQSPPLQRHHTPQTRILHHFPPRTFSTSPLRQANRYQSFNRSPQQGPNILLRWASSPTFYYQIGGLGVVVGGVYIANLEEVPVSGRRRFRIASDEFVLKSSHQAYVDTLNENRGRIFPEHHPAHQLVERVLERLIPHVPEYSGQPTDWKVHVLANDEPNAFVLPGGKVFVNSGILPICAGEDGLAAVLGHEIAHNVAGHVGEKMSQSTIFSALAFVLNVGAIFLGLPDIRIFTHLAIDLGLTKPNSRTQESEADYIGLLIMSEACYDPRAAVGLWERMEQAAGAGPPQFLSTHPASRNRMVAIEEWLPKAEAKREESNCQPLLDYSRSFNQAFRRWT
ncbi:hypothetical protein K461DRAFT_244311 [Myriangium duriaei CBS 260.36]|uniref:Peptidase M48 domain-containing protein n=1 Tax=Myriangium duriaei CBS 260.36 TaxID=1168546 RepID=A0A9P4IY18_9PEZI|nr:hypothetical protein K461DRAFT_244311 [Myriangium duriaei CBS 260.36]